LLKTSHDNRSRDWAYAYTDEPDLLAAFPKGVPFVKMAFRDAFTMIAEDSRFGGIHINHTEKYMYVIPAEVFDRVWAQLDVVPRDRSNTEG
jgi:hypothetical protein